MSRRSVLTLVLLVVAMCYAFVPAQAGGKSTRTEVSGFIGLPGGETEPGEGWLSGPIYHHRGQVIFWASTATDERLTGTLFDEFNANLDTRTLGWDGPIWGKLWIEQDGVRVWEGTWNGEFLGGIQQGRAVLHGVGEYHGLKAKMTFVQTGPATLEFEAVILDPHGG